MFLDSARGLGATHYSVKVLPPGLERVAPNAVD